MFNQLGVIGCGLIGGSFALALKRAGLVRHVVGYSKSPSTTELAKRQGVIDVAAESALLAVSGSDIVLIAVPVSATDATLKAIRHLVNPQMLIMDVGSTKGSVVESAKKILRDKISSFIPAHPIAGKEVSGVAHAEATLFAGRQVILTPLPMSNAAMLQKATDVWSAVGSQVLLMSPANHDAAYAAVSHLPHFLAVSFFNGILQQKVGPDYVSLAGPGFRDFTRIAASDPQIWRDILLSNSRELGVQLGHFRAALAELENALMEGDADTLQTLITRAARARGGWNIGHKVSTGSPPSKP